MASAVARALAYNGGLGAVPPAGSRGTAQGLCPWTPLGAGGRGSGGLGAKPTRSWTQLYIS